MTAEQDKIIDDLFHRYGAPSNETEIRVSDYLIKPSHIDELKRIEYYDNSAAETIKRMEKYIEVLKVYRLALYEQYNFLKTSPVERIIKLKREKRDNKVYYYLIEIEKNLENNHETTTNSTKYAGSDRKKAFDDFNAYIKNHPGITAIQDTEKGKWER